MADTGSDTHHKKEQEKKEAEDEVFKQIVLNQKHMDDIKEDIAKNMPFISEEMTFDEYMTKWNDTRCQKLTSEFKTLRELRRDGNCFYRAVLWQMWEFFMKNLNVPEVKADFERMKGVIEGSKKDLMDFGYDETAIDLFYDCFLDEFKKIEEESTKGEESQNKFLNKLFCTMEWGPYMIMYARFLTGFYLKKNAILYEAFLTEYHDIETFVNSEVDPVDHEAE